jgi:hypothetical protein
MREPLRYFALLGVPGHTLIVGGGFQQLVAGNVDANKFGHGPTFAGAFPAPSAFRESYLQRHHKLGTGVIFE